MGEVRNMIYGRDDNTPVDTTIRGAALDAVRTVRAARISSEHRIARAIQKGEPQEARMLAPTPSALRKLLRGRLEAAIISDWWLRGLGQLKCIYITADRLLAYNCCQIYSV